MKHKYIFLIILYFLFIPKPALGAVLFNNSFSYYAKQQDLPAVLMEFAKSQNYFASFSPKVEGKLSGKFNHVPPLDFLNSIHSAFQISWYTVENTLYFYHDSEYRQSYLAPVSMPAAQMYELLKSAGIFSKQLMPKLANSGSMITISGPQNYIQSIMDAAQSFELSQTQNIIMRVFPLKYAWADDMTISSMDRNITIPGIAAILRAMVTGSPLQGTQPVRQKATVDGLNGSGLSSVGNEASQETEQTKAPSLATNIIADPRVNAVIINDAAYRMPYYEKVIADLDKEVELVEIHAAIVDIDTDYRRDLGVTYQAANNRDEGWSSGGELGSGQGGFSALPELGNSNANGLALSTVYTMGADFFLAKIQALEEDGEARMLGKPSILTVDNIQATLENTSTYYLEVAGNETVDLFKVEAGTVLRVTPHIIHNDGSAPAIKLAVTVQDNQNDGQQSAALKPDGISPIKQTKINTQAIIGTNQSLLIGGYYYEEKVENESGIPVLKNIPFIGHAFKSTSKNTRRMERLILITPKIIRLNELPAAPAYVDEQSFTKSPVQADYEERIPLQPAGTSCTRKNASANIK